MLVIVAVIRDITSPHGGFPTLRRHELLIRSSVAREYYTMPVGQHMPLQRSWRSLCENNFSSLAPSLMSLDGVMQLQKETCLDLLATSFVLDRCDAT